MTHKIAIFILMIVSAIIFSIFLGLVTKSVKIRDNGVLVNGTVMDSKRSGSKSPMRTVTISFHTNDGSQVTSTASTRQYVKQGDVLKVYYDPESPQKIDFGDTIRYNMRGVIIGGLLFIFALYYFIKYSIRDRLNNKLRSRGKKVSAEFVSVERNEKYRMGPNNPWVIKCRWVDETSKQEYYYFSKDYTIDPSPYLKGISYVDVFTDPYEPEKYFMDTPFMPKGNNTFG